MSLDSSFPQLSLFLVLCLSPLLFSFSLGLLFLPPFSFSSGFSFPFLLFVFLPLQLSLSSPFLLFVFLPLQLGLRFPFLLFVFLPLQLSLSFPFLLFVFLPLQLGLSFPFLLFTFLPLQLGLSFPFILLCFLPLFSQSSCVVFWRVFFLSALLLLGHLRPSDDFPSIGVSRGGSLGLVIVIFVILKSIKFMPRKIILEFKF